MTKMPRHPLFSGAILFVLALIPRLYVALAWTREPVWDGHYYDIGARSIAAGLGYVGVNGNPWCHYPVGYSGFLGAIYWIFGPGRHTAPIANAVLGSLLVVAVYALTWQAQANSPGVRERQRRSFVAGLLAACYPGFIAYTPLLMTESLASVLLLLAPLAALRGGRRGMVAAGILLGLGSLVRPQSILCAPALFFLAPSVSTDLKKRVAATVLSTAIAFFTVLPWTLRNCQTMDGCAWVSTNGGWNLAIGSFPRATGRFAALRPSDGCRITRGQVQQDRCWGERGWQWIAADPKRWLALMPKKLSHTFDHESFPIGYLAEADPQSWPPERKKLGRALLSYSHFGLLFLAPFAFVARPSRRRPTTLLALLFLALLLLVAIASPAHPFWPFALALLLFALIQPGEPSSQRGVLAYVAWAVLSVVAVHAVFFGEDRYHLVITPLLCIATALVGRSSSR
jgi:4-amino-4-deoxy-L-arabinose transferase-like glycosyltransferase